MTHNHRAVEDGAGPRRSLLRWLGHRVLALVLAIIIVILHDRWQGHPVADATRELWTSYKHRAESDDKFRERGAMWIVQARLFDHPEADLIAVCGQPTSVAAHRDRHDAIIRTMTLPSPIRKTETVRVTTVAGRVLCFDSLLKETFGP